MAAREWARGMSEEVSGELHLSSLGILWHYIKSFWNTLALLLLRFLLRLLNSPHFPLRQFLCSLNIHTLCILSNSCSRFLLPPRRRANDRQLTVVLDLDETLVCAYDAALLPAGLHTRAVEGGMEWFQLQCLASDSENTRIDYVVVYERPGLREFLARASEFAELVLFTAGLEGYAKPLIDKIDPESRISTRLYRPSTVLTKFREHVKDLSRLGRDLRRTVIIDNNPFSFVLQPLNGIPCVPFTAENPSDSQLLDVLLPLLESLSGEEDIRPVLSEQFQMPGWFRSRCIPAGKQSDTHEL